MISLEKWKIFTPLQNLPKIVGDLGQSVVAKGFKKLPKVQKIAKSDHTVAQQCKFLRLGLYGHFGVIFPNLQNLHLSY